MMEQRISFFYGLLFGSSSSSSKLYEAVCYRRISSIRSLTCSLLIGHTTLISFYKEWHWKQVYSANVQFSEEFFYNRLQYAWYSFVQLLDFDYLCGFACPECSDTPETVMMDGVGLSIRKSFMPWKDYLNHPYSVAPLDGRNLLWIPDDGRC